MLQEKDWNQRRLTLEWQAIGRREDIGKLNQQYRLIAWNWIKMKLKADSEDVRSLGLALGADAPSTIFRSKKDGLPTLEVHSVRAARRSVEGGATKLDLVMELIQRRRGYLHHEAAGGSRVAARGLSTFLDRPPADFKFRGGCTLLIDGETGDIRYCILKSIRSDATAGAPASLRVGARAVAHATYSPADPRAASREPFALLHRTR